MSKSNNVLIDNAENLDVVMPMYNLLEYSKNYRKTTRSLWNYYRHERNNPPLVGNLPTANYNAVPITNSALLKYKSSITGKHQMQFQKMVETLSRIIQRLKQIVKLLFIKTIK